MADKIEWRERYRTDIEEIDLQHRQLFHLLDALLEARRDPEIDVDFKAIVKELIDYAFNHFQTEERLFKEHDYENAEAHIALHTGFVNELTNIKDRVEAGDPTVSADVVEFLKGWLINHIAGSDMAYVSVIKSHGKSSR